MRILIVARSGMKSAKGSVFKVKMKNVADGGGGIRTHVPFRDSCFQDRRLKPLGHPSRPGDRTQDGQTYFSGCWHDRQLPECRTGPAEWPPTRRRPPGSRCRAAPRPLAEHPCRRYVLPTDPWQVTYKSPIRRIVAPRKYPSKQPQIVE